MQKKINKIKSITYKEAGVDIDKFEIILNDLKKEILSTFNDSVINNFGSFSSVLDINKLGYTILCYYLLQMELEQNLN